MHALRLYQDRDSKGIRIQASAHGGEMRRSPPLPFPTLSRSTHTHKHVNRQPPDNNNARYRTPIWTAFITHHITSTTWLRRRNPKVIHLRELNRFIFSPVYRPQYGPHGEHELHFTLEDGQFPLLCLFAYHLFYTSLNQLSMDLCRSTTDRPGGQMR